MRNRFFATIVAIIFTSPLFAQSNQSCPFIDAGPDRTVDCLNPCTILDASYLEIKQTDTYVVDTLPYVLPIPYGQSGGTAVSANTDDVWGPIINLPFPFCYYGNTYTTCKIGSNGSILFGPTSGGGGHPWAFSASVTPTSGINGAGHVLGIYHDIDPSVCGNIKWYLVGQAPCRQFIVAFDNICHFSCTSIKSRHMMVLNEGTNYIDVYVESKPTCSSWNGGRAVIGLQYINQNGGITAPNRNSAPLWDVTTPEAWRFKPNGAELQSVEWFDGTTLVGTGDSLEVCPAQTKTYTAKLSFTICGTSNISTVTDFVTVFKDTSAVQFTTVNPLCFGQQTGEINIITNGVNAPYIFQLDTLPTQTSNVFSNLPAGTYTVSVTDTSNCETIREIVITEPPLLTLELDTVINTICNLANGTILVTAAGGVNPLSYTLDNFSTSQTNGSFLNVPNGNYIIQVNDANNCNVSVNATVISESAIQLSQAVTQNVTCFGADDGTAIIQASSGPEPYVFTLNGTSVSSSQLDSLAAGSYSFSGTDANGCQSSVTFQITQPDELIATANPTTTVCRGTPVTITGTAIGGTEPYNFVWNNNLNGDTITATPLQNTIYNLVVTDANGCSSTNTVSQTILPIPVASATFTPKQGFIPLSVTFTNTSQNATSYIWDFGDGQSTTSTSLSPVSHSYTTEDTFYVQMIATNGICSSIWTDSVMIVPYLQVQIPNVFTPNGDSINEGYAIWTKNATGIEATIINRWGNVIKKINDVAYKWDGKTDNGDPVSDGIYFIKYTVYGHNNQEITGHTFFHLIR